MKLRASVKVTQLHRPPTPQYTPFGKRGRSSRLCIPASNASSDALSARKPFWVMRRDKCPPYPPPQCALTNSGASGQVTSLYPATTRPPAGSRRTSRSRSTHEPQRHREAITCSSASDVRCKSLPPGSPAHRHSTRQTIAITADGSAATGIADWMRPAEDVPAPKLVEAGP
jgi:hypothetical protein